MDSGRGSEKINILSPEEILSKSRFIKGIISPDENSLSYNGAPIGKQLKSAIESIKKQEVKGVALSDIFEKKLRGHLFAYLKAPIIRTKFGEDDNKHIFEDALKVEGGYDLFRSNRLEERNIKNVLNAAEDFSSIFFMFDEKSQGSINEKLAEIRSMMPEEFNKMTAEKQEALAGKAAELAREVCIDVIETARKK
jgi:hypothetical protein